MFKKSLIALSLGLLLAACNGGNSSDPVAEIKKGCTDPNARNYDTNAKVEDCSCQYDMPSQASTTVPSQFTTKILLEEMTGGWCGWCVDGAVIMDKLVTENKGQVIGVAIHQGDEMQNSEVLSSITRNFVLSGYPSGLVNRIASASSGSVIMGRGEWETNASRLKNNKVDMGLAIDATVQNDELKVMVHVANKAKALGNYRLTVYLVEDGLVYTQQNYHSGYLAYPNHPYFSKPKVITDYVHNKVVRRAIPNSNGTVIPDAAKEANKIFKKMFVTPLTGYKKGNLKIVAFVTNDGTSTNSKNVINVQELTLPVSGNATKNFD